MWIALFILFCFAFALIGFTIAGRVVQLLAKRWWDGDVSFHTRYYGKHGYARGFAFFEGENALVGRRTCILTIIYYAIGVPILLLLFIGLMPRLMSWLQP